MTAQITRHGVITNPIFDTVTTVENVQRWHFFAGRCGADETRTEVRPGDYRADCERILATLTAELEGVGASWSDVVYQRVHALDVDAYLSEADDLVKDIYAPNKMAPGTLVGVTRLAKPQFLIEIDIVAVT